MTINQDEITLKLYNALLRRDWKDAMLQICKGGDVTYGQLDRVGRGESSRSILTLAIDSNDPTIVDAVLSSVKSPKTAAELCNGGDVILSSEGAIHYAVKVNCPNVFAKLVEHGADIQFRDLHGKTPFDLATAIETSSPRSSQVRDELNKISLNNKTTTSIKKNARELNINR